MSVLGVVFFDFLRREGSIEVCNLVQLTAKIHQSIIRPSKDEFHFGCRLVAIRFPFFVKMLHLVNPELIISGTTNYDNVMPFSRRNSSPPYSAGNDRQNRFLDISYLNYPQIQPGNLSHKTVPAVLGFDRTIPQPKLDGERLGCRHLGNNTASGKVRRP